MQTTRGDATFRDALEIISMRPENPGKQAPCQLVGMKCRACRTSAANTHQRAQIHDRREHDPIDRELLDAVEERLALAGIALSRLLVEQIVDVGIAPIG